MSSVVVNSQKLRGFVDIMVRPLWTMLKTSVRELLRNGAKSSLFTVAALRSIDDRAVKTPLGALSMREASRLIDHEQLASGACNLTHLKR
jgi:hypothetical protein